MIAFLTLCVAAQATEPTTSLLQLSSANGYGVIVLDGGGAAGPVLNRFNDHLYQTASADADDTRDLLYDTYFGLNAEGAATWLTASDSVAIQQGTNALTADRSKGSLTITEINLAPMGLDIPGFAQILHVQNTSRSSVPAVVVFSLHNFHLGSDDDGDGVADEDENIWVDGGVLYEQGDRTGLTMVSVPLKPASTFSCDSVYDTVGEGEGLDGRCGTASSPWLNDDQVGGFQWDIGNMAPGASVWLGVVSGFAADWDEASALMALNTWAGGSTADALANAEALAWEDWLSSATVPADLSEEETALYLQSLLYLKAGQVREDGDAGAGAPAATEPSTGRLCTRSREKRTAV